MNERNLEVLEQYELTMESARRGRGAWICKTDRGFVLLREYRGTTKRLEFEEAVLASLREQGGIRVDSYVRNKEGELLSTAEDGSRYIVKEWYPDRECEVQNEEEAVRAVEVIARLHRQLRLIVPEEDWNLGSILTEPMEKEMERHNRELRRVRNFISRKRKKSEFELSVIETFEPFFAQAKEACDGLLQMGREQGMPEQYLCHGELNQHHILKGEDGIAITEFHRMHLGVQAGDVYHFIRKVLEKHDWDRALGHRLLTAYDAVLSMGAKDREYLYYLFLYPEKYWKQLNFYYNAGKTWIPARNTEKIKKLAAQQEARASFLRELR